MSPAFIAIAELVLVLGAVLAFAVWELRSLRRLRQRSGRPDQD